MYTLIALLLYTYLTKSKILVHIDLHTQGRKAWSRAKSRFLHLLIDKLAECFLCDTKRDVPNVESTGLSGNLTGSRLGERGNRQGGSGMSNSRGRNPHSGHLTSSYWALKKRVEHKIQSIMATITKPTGRS